MTEISNRLTNETLNTTMVGGSVLLQPSTPMGEDALRVVRLGPFTLVPAGLTAMSSSFNPPLQGMLLAKGMLSGILQANTGAGRGQTVDDSGTKTAKEAMIKASTEARFEKNQVSYYYVQQDRLHRETFRRLSDKNCPATVDGADKASEFRKRCIDRGVPAQYLDSRKCVIYAARVIGFGSPFMRQELTQQYLNMMPFVGARGRLSIIREWFAARSHYSMIDQYVSQADIDAVPTNENSIISLENNDMVDGNPIEAGVDQDHERHFLGHAGPALQVVDAYMKKQTIDVARILPWFIQLVQHLQQHLQFMADNPVLKQSVKRYEAVLSNILSAGKMMEKEAQTNQDMQMQQRQQQIQTLQQAQGGLPPELAVKLREIELNHIADMEKVRLNAERNDMKTRHQMMLADAKTAATIKRMGEQE